MKTLWQTIKNSIHNPDFYRGLSGTPFKTSLKYFYTLGLVLVFIATLFYSIIFVPALYAFLRAAGPKILNYYPSELVVTLKGGHVTTNVTEPYYLKMPPELQSLASEKQFKEAENLLVINTQAPFSVDELKSYKTAILLTGDSLVYDNGNGKIEIHSLAAMPDQEISQSTVADLLGKIQPFLKFLVPLLVVGLFLVGLLIYSNILVYLLLGIFLVKLVLKLKKLPQVGWMQAYQIGLHAATLGILVVLILRLAAPGVYFPFLFTTLFIIALWTNLRPAPTEAKIHLET